MEQTIVQDLNDQMLRRREKLAALIEMGLNPYTVESFDRTHTCQQVHDDFESLTEQQVAVCGRVVALRHMGKAAFLHVEDWMGKIQIYLRKDDIGEEAWPVLKLLDIGDYIGVTGKPFLTKTGEQSIHAESVQVLSKCLRPIPYGKEKEGQNWNTLQDVEIRYRQRYLDLLTNDEGRARLIQRCRIISMVRRWLDDRGFLEVETPMLQEIAGGAAAKPFMTHHNALDFDFKLRISIELYLKRLIVGNIEKVYEIGKVFRNEGMDRRHNPEFTLLELYQAYVNLEEMMEITEQLFYTCCMQLHGVPFVEVAGTKVDFTPPWPRRSMMSLIEEHTGVKPEEFATFDTACAAMERCGLPTADENQVGGIMEKLLERFVQPKMIQPVFITDHPLETSPLAKKRQDDPTLTRRFEAYIIGQEVANAFSELNDPDDQRERFMEQLKMRAAGDDEAHPLDEEFLQCLEYGMPPTGGIGIGMDRMAIILTAADSIQDVMFFPAMKPKSQG